VEVVVEVEEVEVVEVVEVEVVVVAQDWGLLVLLQPEDTSQRCQNGSDRSLPYFRQGMKSLDPTSILMHPNSLCSRGILCAPLGSCKDRHGTPE